MAQSKALDNVFKLTGIVDPKEPRFGAKGDGTTNDAVALQAFLTALQSGGRGVVPDGTYNLGSTALTFSYSPTSLAANIEIDFGNAKFVYTGSGSPIEFSETGNNADGRHLTLIGGAWVCSSSAASGPKFNDIARMVWFYPRVHDASNGPAFWHRNVNDFSENNFVLYPQVTGCKYLAQFDGAAITGGGGTESFARTQYLHPFVSSIGEYVFYIRGGMYDSLLFNIRGNIGTGCKAVVYHSSGDCAETLIDGIRVEGARSSTNATGAITASDRTLTTTGAFFASTDVGWPVKIPGAGQEGRDLYAIIATFTSSQEVEIDRDASTTVSGQTIEIGPAGVLKPTTNTANSAHVAGVDSSLMVRVLLEGDSPWYWPSEKLTKALEIDRANKLTGAFAELYGRASNAGVAPSNAYYAYVGHGNAGSANTRLVTLAGISHNSGALTDVGEVAVSRGSAGDEGRITFWLKTTGQALARAFGFRRGGTTPVSQVGEVIVGDGAPEGVESSARGSLYLRTDGAQGSSTYEKVSGTGNTSWRAVGVAVDSAANIASAAATINTANKHQGRLCFDTTNNRLMVASGGGATDNWYIADGSASVTPS